MKTRVVLPVGYNGSGKTHVVQAACELLKVGGYPFVVRETGALILPAVISSLREVSDVPPAVLCEASLLAAYYPNDPQKDPAPEHVEWLSGRKEEVRQRWVIPAIQRIRETSPNHVLELFVKAVRDHSPEQGPLFLNGCRANDLEFLEMLPGCVEARVALISASQTDRKTWSCEAHGKPDVWFVAMEERAGTPEHALREWLLTSQVTVYEVRNGADKELAAAQQLYELATT